MSASVDWRTCTHDPACNGVQVGPAGECLAHLSSSDLGPVLAQMKRSGVLDARGVRISSTQLDAFVSQVSRTGLHGERLLQTVRFDAAQLDGEVDFADLFFTDEASFRYVVFEGRVDCQNTKFQGAADFSSAEFRFGANFRSAKFVGEPNFQHARFIGDASFYAVDFVAGATFGGAVFEKRATFQNARFVLVDFDESAGTGDERVEPSSWFYGVQFGGMADFRSARFAGHITTFEKARFAVRVVFDEAFVTSSWLVLDDATLGGRAVIKARAKGVSCVRTRFDGGVRLLVEDTDVVLEETDLRELSTVEFGPPSIFHRFSNPATIENRPRLVSLRRTNVERLALYDVDLSGCRFAGVHNLDRLRIESDDAFARSPPTWRHARREVIAEEWEWRITRGRWPGTSPFAWPGTWTIYCEVVSDAPEALPAQQIARIYRALRKAREDAKDEPGAADFYYGEMEMRRNSRPGLRGGTGGRMTGWGERVILWLYWLVSGYGLRASRALGALLVTVVGFALLLYFVGLHNRDLSSAFVESAAGATLRGGTPRLLDESGKAIEIALRLLGPLFLALAILSFRGRVKR